MIKRIFSVILTLIAIGVAVQAQDFIPSTRWFGDLRVRNEVDMRDFNKLSAANTYTLLRTRLALEAVPFENVRVFIQARDSRVFGQERDAANAFSTLADSRNLDLHQGYVEIKKLFTDELTLRLGRQELSYANERLIGAVGWHNVGRSFDGGLLRLDFPSVSIDLLAMNVAEVQSYTPVATPAAVRYTTDRGSDFYALYATLKQVPNHKIDAYFLYQWDRNQTVAGKYDLNRYTLGSYAKGKADAFDYEVELAYQTGDGRGASVEAWMLAGTAGYSFANATLSRLAVGYEVLSGTPVGDTKYKSFDPLYHTGHKFYGFMDYFINVPANTGERGLVDMFARATLSLSDKLTANVWLHQFTQAQSVGGESALGQEIDLVALYRYNKSVSFEFGVSTFVPAYLMRERFKSPGVNAADASFWGYLTTMVSF